MTVLRLSSARLAIADPDECVKHFRDIVDTVASLRPPQLGAAMYSEAPAPPVLALPGPVYCYRYDGDFAVNGHPIIVHQEGGQGRGTAWAVWDGAAAAAKYLEAAREELLAQHAFSSVLELGSGTGLAGLAAAAALQLPTLLTDLAEALPALQRNIAANASLAQLVAAAPLDWRDPGASPALKSQGSSSITGSSSGAAGNRTGSSGSGGLLVLAADCVWLEELVQPFVSALELAASAPADRALLAYQSRSERTDDLLFSLLARRFEVVPLPLLPGEPPRGPIDLYWLTPKLRAVTPVSL